MSGELKYVLGSQATLMSTELDSLGVNTGVTSNYSYNNTQGQTGDGYTLCDLELFLVALGFGAPNVEGVALSIWFMLSQDNINYEDNSSNARRPSCTFPLRGVNADQRIIRKGIWVPQGLFKTFFINATLLTMNNGNTLSIRPVSKQVV